MPRPWEFGERVLQTLGRVVDELHLFRQVNAGVVVGLIMLSIATLVLALVVSRAGGRK